MKKLLSILAFLAISIGAFAQEPVLVDGIYYNFINDCEVEVTRYEGDYSGDVEIPELINVEGNEYSVKSIAEGAFAGCPELTSVSIPVTIDRMGAALFEGCENLKEIYIWTDNFSYAFDGLNYDVLIYATSNFWYSLYRKYPQFDGVNIRDYNLIKMGEFFYYLDKENLTAEVSSETGRCWYENGQSEVEIPATITFGEEEYDVTSIGANAFYGYQSLGRIFIPESVTTIGVGAFLSCYNLAEITIPESVTSIGDVAFNNCTMLRSVTFISSTPPEMGDYVFDNISWDATLYVSAGSRAVYANEDWSSFFNEIKSFNELPVALQAIPQTIASGNGSVEIPLYLRNQNDGVEIDFNIDGPSCMSFANRYVGSFGEQHDDFVQINGISASLNDVEDGVYTITLTNVKYRVIDSENWRILPDYNVSVIVGTPSVREATLYGYFNSDAITALNTASKNIAVLDMTNATIEDVDAIQDVIVKYYDGLDMKGCYNRYSENYGTTCLPYDLSAADDVHFYVVEDMTPESITISEVDFAPANQPYIFRGTIKVTDYYNRELGEIGNIDFGYATFRGTYDATSVEAGAGYYIASNGKFYNDGASVRPFRGYIDGTISGAKSLTIDLQTEDGIVDITNQFSAEDIYNIWGIRTNADTKGINIIGGKKVLVK